MNGAHRERDCLQCRNKGNIRYFFLFFFTFVCLRVHFLLTRLVFRTDATEPTIRLLLVLVCSIWTPYRLKWWGVRSTLRIFLVYFECFFRVHFPLFTHLHSTTHQHQSALTHTATFPYIGKMNGNVFQLRIFFSRLIRSISFCSVFV